MIRIVVSGVLVLAGFAFGYSGGSGTQADPFKISDANDIMELSGDTANYDKHFVLTNDIQMTGTFTTAVVAPIDDLEDPVFEGVFDGDGFKIDGLLIDSTGTYNSNLGFFGGIGENGIVRNLGVTGFNISSNDRSANWGGICGYNWGKIYNCHATGNMTSGRDSARISGLCGLNTGSISRSYAAVSIIAKSETYSIGGLCGRNDYGTIESCYSITDITCIDNLSINFSSDIGGLSGQNTGTILNCYAIGSIYGDHISSVGGLSGISFFGGIYRSYAAVIISYHEGSSIGGLCSRGALSQIYQCFWDVDISGVAYSFGGQPVSSADMMKSSTFADWDGGTWIIDEGNDYPRLAWGSASGEPITTEYPARTYPGDGVAHPFEIDSVEDIICMSKRITDWDKNFVMTADVDMSSVTDYIPPTDFRGIFDGQCHIVSNLTIDANNVGNICSLGLFGIVMDEGVVKNLSMSNFEMIGSEDSVGIGGVCGLNYGSLINCNADGYIHSVEGWHFGLICGLNDGAIADCNSSGVIKVGAGGGGVCGMNYDNGNISNCRADAQIYALAGGGGLCGANSGTIDKCRAQGDIYSRVANLEFWYWDGFGGFCGDNEWGTIRNSFSLADVHDCDGTDNAGGFAGLNSGNISMSYCHGSVESTGPAGGFCGLNESVISDCYSKGTLRTTWQTGGFCCTNDNKSEITNCYTAVAMESTGPTGGFCYDNAEDAVITGCFWDKELSGVNTSDGGVGLETNEMYRYQKYYGWDIAPAYYPELPWNIRDGYDYPMLSWEYIVPGDVVGDYVVNLEDFEAFVNAWWESIYYPWCDLEFDFDNSGNIDLGDLMVICQNWLERR